VPIDLTRRVIKAFGLHIIAARAWYHQPSEAFGGKTPCEVNGTLEGARALRAYLEDAEIQAVRAKTRRA
jgi:hypothetical protein